MSQNGAIASLQQYFPKFVESFIQKIQKEDEVSDVNADRIVKMLEYNCIGGKYFRGASVVTFAQAACEKKGTSFEAISEAAHALGWAVEVLQAYFLISDDIMDNSTVRRGKPCWYRHDNVKMDAINDAFITESFMIYLIEHYITDPTDYIFVNKAFQDVKLKTELGQMSDLLSQPQGRKGSDILDKFNLDLHAYIVKYKTAFYTFYLPALLGCYLGGYKEQQHFDSILDISLELGHKFQVQDDYLDCYQDPAILGKVGTDIQDHKCSWLVAIALTLVNPEQKKVLYDNYGKEDEESVQRIKDLYKELNLTAIYEKQEEDSLQRLRDICEKHKDVFPTEFFNGIIARVHGRQK